MKRNFVSAKTGPFMSYNSDVPYKRFFIEAVVGSVSGEEKEWRLTAVYQDGERRPLRFGVGVARRFVEMGRWKEVKEPLW